MHLHSCPQSGSTIGQRRSAGGIEGGERDVLQQHEMQLQDALPPKKRPRVERAVPVEAVTWVPTDPEAGAHLRRQGQKDMIGLPQRQHEQDVQRVDAGQATAPHGNVGAASALMRTNP